MRRRYHGAWAKGQAKAAAIFAVGVMVAAFSWNLGAQAPTAGPITTILDSNGDPVASAKVCTYAAGTSTPLSTYSDSGLTTPNSNPTTADSAGRVVLYLAHQAYKITVLSGGTAGSCADGSTVWTQDQVSDPTDVWRYTSISANLVWAGPASGSSAPPSFRAIVGADVPGVLDFVGGRLTLTSATCVTQTGVTAATTVYFTPCGTNAGLVTVYSSGLWQTFTFTELSIALGTDTANLPYDVFAYNNSGTLAIERLAWSTTNTRATALALQDGRLVKSGDATRRYLGSYYTTAAGQTTDSSAMRGVWNYYNRATRTLKRQESTSTWTYTTATWRQANGSTSNQVAFLQGYPEEPVAVSLRSLAANSSGTDMFAGIGYDDTSSPDANGLYQQFTGAASQIVPFSAEFSTVPNVGYHSITWLEKSSAAGTTTWYGFSSGNRQSGLIGWGRF